MTTEDFDEAVAYYAARSDEQEDTPTSYGKQAKQLACKAAVTYWHLGHLLPVSPPTIAKRRV